ncbi:ABC transporter substrate binding protein [Noviherbaspirillum sp. CPCC 100848]|uniref:ABC transporter substrate binding protein n=1 Tax=Noviherbaspirillum album TaxID=3080276 RepID=A0ABU6JBK8_9BURK|nr:ABC transporter substrate binding protein [Noviherbaspirillum sp. CPCC 100848]MEC4720700.1 ABC transporter substrate binding protein [Noviherbaspirillum sp. CPCC 100848]
MSKNIKLESIFIGLFLVVALGLFAWFNMSKPSILILHSYDKSYAWTRDVNVGLERVLNNNYRYQVRWYYMDTKRRPYPEYRSSAGIAARRFIEQMQPDVVIAIDDDAQQYVSRHFINDPKMKIVFAGINNSAADYGLDKANNATGIMERIPLPAIRETFLIADNLKSLGRPVRLALLADKSESVSGDIKQLQGFNWDPVQLVSINRAASWPDWQAKVRDLAGKADVIMVTGYRRLARSETDKSLVPPHEVVHWTEMHSSVPVISGNGFFTEEGGMLAIGTSPYEQGETAARMALDIVLRGKHPKEFPIVSSSQFIVTMNGARMQVRGFKLPKVYEAAARTGNKYFDDSH